MVVEEEEEEEGKMFCIIDLEEMSARKFLGLGQLISIYFFCWSSIKFTRDE